jgi:hypothetical protein
MNEEVFIDYEQNKVLIVNNNTLTDENEPICIEMTIEEYQAWIENDSRYVI